MNRILGFLVVLGLFASVIALVFAFWPFFVGLAVLSALALAFSEWRKGAPARKETRLAKEWSRNKLTPEEEVALEERLQRRAKAKARLAELGIDVDAVEPRDR